MNTEALNQIIETHSGVSLTDLATDYPALVIENTQASATIALHGAHLIDFNPTNKPPVIFTSNAAIYKEKKAIRGGIPICWPYFNAHPTETDFPSHGIARTRFWDLVSIESSTDAHTIIFEMPILESDLKIIGGTCKLTATFHISDSLTISLNTTNTDQKPLTIGGALHTYLQLGSITTTTISGINGVSHLDTLTDETSTHSGDLFITGEYDRVFLPSAHTVTLTDSFMGSSITIEKQNSMATTIWNPWIDKSLQMSDLGNKDYLQFVCIEAINWKDDLRTLAPQETHALVQKISIT